MPTQARQNSKKRNSSAVVTFHFFQASPDIHAQIKHFKEFIDHNEFELALDALEELGEIARYPGGFWRDLKRADLAMELNSRADRL
jgi:hypothetical protein